MGRGRPSKIQDAKIKKALLEAIGYTMTYQDACAYAGVSVQTFWLWRTTAEQALADMAEGGAREGKSPLKKDIPYIEFWRELQEVEQKTQFELSKSQIKLAKGGGRVRETVTTEMLLPNEDGQFVVARIDKRVHVKELAPDGTAGRYILDRRFGWDGAGDGSQDGGATESVKDFKERAEKWRTEADEALSLFDDLDEGGDGD